MRKKNCTITETFKIDASWAEKLTKTRVSFLTAPTYIHSMILPHILRAAARPRMYKKDLSRPDMFIKRIIGECAAQAIVLAMVPIL